MHRALRLLMLGGACTVGYPQVASAEDPPAPEETPAAVPEAAPAAVPDAAPAAAPAPALSTEGVDYAEMSLEDLLNTVITASKRTEAILTAPAVVTVITQRDIVQYGGLTLLDVLERTVGVMSWSISGFPRTSFSVRGDFQGGPKRDVLTLINGRPFRESEQGGMDAPFLTALPLSAVEKIEFIRGPGSVLYGSDAYAGVINIRLRQSASKDASVTLQYGSFGTVQGTASGSAAIGDLRFFSAATGRKSSGWAYHLIDSNNVDATERFGDRAAGAVASLGFRGLSLDVGYFFSDQDYIGVQPSWPSGQFVNDRLFANAGYTHTLSEKWSASFNLTYNQMTARLANDQAPPNPAYVGNRAINVHGPSRDLLAEVSVQGSPLEKLNLVAGLVVERQTGGGATSSAAFPAPNEGVEIENRVIKNYGWTWLSAYAQVDYQLHERVSLMGGTQLIKPNAIAAEVVPRASVVVLLREELALKLLYGRAFRAAKALERLIEVPGGLRGDLHLRPARVDTFDVQLSYQGAKYRGTLTGFLLRRDNQFVIVRPDPASPQRTYINDPENQTFYGAELETDLSLTAFLDVTASYLFQGNHNSAGVQNVSNTPHNIIKAGVLLKPVAGVSCGVFNTYYTRWFPVPARRNSNPPAAPADLLSVKVSVDIPRLLNLATLHSLQLGVYGSNLLDTAAYQPDPRGDVNTTPSRPGRAIYGELTLTY
jgi:outer membrane receptor for ferrienterochelin and colicins